MDMKDVGDCTLRVRREMVSLDLGKYTEEDLREAREILARRGATRRSCNKSRHARLSTSPQGAATDRRRDPGVRARTGHRLGFVAGRAFR